MITRSMKFSVLCFLFLALASCSSTSIRTTEYTPVIKAPGKIPEAELLDVGIGIFDPGIDKSGKVQDGVYPEVRKAEARYMPYKLMQTLQSTGNWGAVRVIPNRQSEMDVWVDAKILRSDGVTLKLDVTVSDSTGKVWFTKKYSETASKYAYDTRLVNKKDPFQGIYNRIANDMMRYREQFTSQDALNIRTVTKLKFARRFAPEAFSNYLSDDGKGHYTVKRLPAANDPLLQRIKRIRERDDMFVDTLQDYYGSFVKKMQAPYNSWRGETYSETLALQETRRNADSKLIGGAAAVIAGILGAASNSSLAQVAGYVGIAGGAYLAKEGLGERANVKMHEEALKELGTSLNASVEPHTITLQNKTVTLSGTVDQQYKQWRQILSEIYRTETGQTTPVTN